MLSTIYTRKRPCEGCEGKGGKDAKVYIYIFWNSYKNKG